LKLKYNQYIILCDSYIIVENVSILNVLSEFEIFNYLFEMNSKKYYYPRYKDLYELSFQFRILQEIQQNYLMYAIDFRMNEISVLYPISSR